MKITRKETAIIIIATAVAGLIRFFSSFDDLWIDEVWSLESIRGISNVWEIFGIHSDNNHILNSIYLFYFGEGDWWPRYRFLSILSGTALVPLIGWFGFRKGFLEGLIVLTFVTFSVPLVIYSSEARGYAPAMFFSILAFIACQNYGKDKNSRLIFWSSSILGILSHLTFLYVFTAFFAASVFHAGYKWENICSQLKKMFFWYFVPSAFIIVFLFFWRDIDLGGGRHFFFGIQRLVPFLAPALGLPKEYSLSILISLCAFATTTIWVYQQLDRQFNSTWIMYGMTVVIMPLVGFLAPVPFFDPRYLSLSLPFFYLLLAEKLAMFIGQAGFTRIICLLLLTTFIVGSITMLNTHIKIGRGNYFEALSYMINESKGGAVSIVSDHDFRNLMLVNFYSRFVKSDKKIELFSRSRPSQEKDKPEWYIKHEFDRHISPPMGIDWFDKKYKFESIFPYSGIASGWSWFIYRNMPE